MSLREDATELSQVLNLIIQGLQQYNDERRSAYTSQLARRLMPIVAAYDDAVFKNSSREEAACAIAELSECMHEVNGAATKGDMDFVSGEVLNLYWHLRTIFQESKYRGMSL